jgi:potassium efflux system protein
MIRNLLSLMLALILVIGAEQVVAQVGDTSAAQVAQTVDYDAWENEADRIENLLEAGTASTSFFENLRATLVGWREQFLAAQNSDSARIGTLEAQIEALGPVPEDGSAEPDAIAERRASLEDRLAEARVPQINATAAFTRANGLIGEIDALLRDRQQQQLLQLDPSPANPVNWAVALGALRDLAVTIQSQIANRFADPVRREALADAAPVIVLLVLLGLLAVFRGRRWTERLTERLQARARTRGRTSVAFLVSLLQITVPLAGVLMLLTAVVTSGMVGPLTTALLEALAGLAVAVYVSLWLAGRLFREDADTAFTQLRAEPGRAMAARRIVVSIGVTVGLALMMETLIGLDQVAPAAHGVLQVPVYVLMAYLFWRAARLLRADIPERAAEELPGFTARALTIVANVLVVLAVVGPLHWRHRLRERGRGGDGAGRAQPRAHRRSARAAARCA